MPKHLSDVILQTAIDFAKKEMANNNGNALEGSIVSAFISGVSLTAHYLTASDGSTTVTPQNIEVSAEQAAIKFGLTKGSIDEN